MRKNSPPTAEDIAQAKVLYDAGARVAEVAATLEMTPAQFLKFRGEHGWPLRPSPIAAPKPPPQKPERSLILRLEDAVEREFARAEAALAKHAPKTIEQSARTLASLVKTLAELKRMTRETRDGDTDERDAADDDDAPPRELADLRAELARRLERLGGDGAAG